MPAQSGRASLAQAASLMTECHSLRRDQAALDGKEPRIAMNGANQQLNAQYCCRLFGVLRP
jgi:hypothetical protein